MSYIIRFMNVIDSFLPRFFEGIANPPLDSLMVFLTRLGDGGVVWIFLIIALLVTKKYRRTAMVAAGSLLFCFILGNYLIKPFFGRIRPCNIDATLRMLIERPIDFSFPSMHTATAFSVAVVIYGKNKFFGILMIVLSCLIALSRVYLNVHYTTDIIFGALFGTAVALAFRLVSRKLKK